MSARVSDNPSRAARNLSTHGRLCSLQDKVGAGEASYEWAS